MGVQMSFQDGDFISFDCVPRNGIARSSGNNLFNVLRNFHTVFYSDCTNLHSQSRAQRFPFLHILARTCRLSSFWSRVGGDVSSWYWFTFPWLLVMVIIVSRTSLPFGCLLWKNGYSVPLLIFESDCFLLLSQTSSLYILYVKTKLDCFYNSITLEYLGRFWVFAIINNNTVIIFASNCLNFWYFYWDISQKENYSIKWEAF